MSTKNITLNQRFNEKGGRFDETLLDNEEDLYLSASNFDKKHLQQFYTPPKFAEFLANCLPVNLKDTDTGNFVFDPTSGNGNLLLPFIKNWNNVCLGVEIDNNNIPADSPANLQFINADFVKLSEYMIDLGFEPTIIVSNPPFGLKWTPQDIESQEWMLKYCIDNLSSFGVGYMICAKSFADKVFSVSRFSELKDKINIRLDVKGLFTGSNANIDTSVLFFSNANMELLQFDIDYLEMPKAKLNGIAAQIKFALQDSARVYKYDRTVNFQDLDLVEGCYHEYKRSKSKFIFDVNYDSVIRLDLTNYKWYKLKNSYPDLYQSLKEIHLKAANYLAFNTKLQRDLRTLVEDELITISPEANEKIESAIRASELLITPFKALPPQQRLGYLSDHTKIKCIKDYSNGEKSYKSGEKYDLETGTHINEVHYDKDVVIDGEEVKRNFFKEVKGLKITIGKDENAITFTEAAEDIRVLAEHFEIPNPMDVATKFPDIHKKLEARLRSEEFAKYTFKEYQIYDLSRAGIKDSLILSWDQGGGKTRGALAWSELKNAKKCIIICPQDLMRQWIKEAKKFDIHLQPILDGESAINAVYSEQGYWITYYEFLSLIDAKNEEIVQYHVHNFKITDGTPALINDYKTYKYPNMAVHIKEKWNDYNTDIGSKFIRKKFFRGWAYVLKNAFDTVIVDEGVKIKTKDAKRGVAVRRFKAKNKLLLSGSPIKNMFVDLYYLFGWLFGYVSSRFPYDYNDRGKFLNDYGTFENMKTSYKERERPPKMLPEINQISLFWKLISPCILRRKKDDFGEELVDKHIHRISCDFTNTQHEQYTWWDQNFEKWFIRTHPDFDMTKVTNTKILGLLWKYRLTATAPHSPKVCSTDTFFNPNPFTNKILACLQIVNEVLARDEQIVIFTGLQENAEFLRNLFGSKCMIANGTLTPKKRSPIIESFKNGTFPILIAGTEAVNLGHSLENCSNLIMMDYVWEHSTTRQAIDRVHRLNSLKDVNIYLLYVKGSYDEVMIEIIDKKGMSSDYALDGELMDQDYMEIDSKKLLKMSIEIFHNLKQNEFISEDLVEEECRQLLKQIKLPRGKQHDLSSLFKKSSPINEEITEVKKFKKKKRLDDLETDSLFD